MHAKTMEGLVGANMNMKMMNTPFRVYQEAERRGDTATMERAMGYVGETADKAEDYQKKVEKGMKEEAKEAREKAKSEQEDANKIAAEYSPLTHCLAVVKAVSGETSDLAQTGIGSRPVEETADAVKTEPVIYTKAGEAVMPESGTNISVSA